MTVRIAVLGAGVVGSSVLRLAGRSYSRFKLEEAAGGSFEIKRVLVRNLKKQRELPLPEGYATTDFAEILSDPEIQIVVSLVGDTEAELNYCLASLRAGKVVVTANKVMLAKYGPELFKAARQSGSALLFEAAVGGGIPFVDALISGRLAVNDITSVQAIINGTTNFILTKMVENGASYNDVLLEAQQLGFAEPDPSFDVGGQDAAFKLAVLASLTFGIWVDVESIHVEGITDVSEKDLWFATKLGYTIKLIASASRNSLDELDLWVAPALVKKGHFLASVGGATNAIMFEGSPIGSVVYQGPGAGGDPTAASVWSDIAKAARSILSNQAIPLPRFDQELEVCSSQNSESHYAIRVMVKDEIGVTRDVGGVFADAGISIDQMLQLDETKRDGEAEAVFTTNTAMRANIITAITQLKALPTCRDITSFMRVIQ